MSLSSFLNFLQNNVQLFVVILIVVGPMIGKMWQNMQKARAKRAQLQRAEQDRIESLRTGRASSMASVPAAIKLDGPRGSAQRGLASPSSSSIRKATAPVPMQQPKVAQPAGKVRSTSSPMGVPTRQIRLPGGIIIEVPDEEAMQRAQRSSPQQASPQGSQRAKNKQQKQKQRDAQRAPSQRTPSGEPQSAIATANQAAREAATADSDALMAAAYGGPGALSLAGPGASGGLKAARSAGGVGTTSASRSPSATMLGLVGPHASREDIRRAFIMSEVLARPKSEQRDD